MKKNNEKLKNAAAGITGATVGTAAGLAGSAAAISSAGVTAGLSGAGIMSGLAGIGGTVLVGGAVVTCGVAILAVGGAFGGIALAKHLTRKPIPAGTPNE